MKLTLLSLLLLLLNSCSSVKTWNRVEVNQEFRLKFQETVLINSANLRVRFAALIQESRCPKNVQCITAGEAVIGLELSENDENWIAKQLSTTSGSNEITHGRYTFKLLEVEPYPVAGEERNPKQYVATLSSIQN